MNMRHQSHLLEQLKAKGWHEKELAYARQVMMDAHVKKPQWHKFLDESVLWFFFMLACLGNFAIVFLISPLLVLFPNSALYGIILILGVSFGLLCELILRDIEHLFTGHHLYVNYILVPFIAIVGALTIFTNASAQLPNIFLISRHPLTLSIIYALSFMLPMIVHKLLLKNSSSKSK